MLKVAGYYYICTDSGNMLEHTLNKPISLRLGYPEDHRRCFVQKCPDLRQGLQPCFFHVDHHASHNDRSDESISDLFHIVKRLVFDKLGGGVEFATIYRMV